MPVLAGVWGMAGVATTATVAVSRACVTSASRRRQADRPFVQARQDARQR